MESKRVTVSISLLAICLAIFVGETAASICYVCDSSNVPSCRENSFNSYAAAQQPFCVCCRKVVADGKTSRECIAEHDGMVKCLGDAGKTYICTGDFCNAANPIGHRGITATIATSLVVGVIASLRLF